MTERWAAPPERLCVDVPGGSKGAQYIGDHRAWRHHIATQSTVYPLGPNNQKVPEPLLTAIDIGRVDLNLAQPDFSKGIET